MNYGGKGNSLLLLKKMKMAVPKTILFDLDSIQDILHRQIESYSHLISEIALWNVSALKLLRQKISQLKMPEEWQALCQEVRGISDRVILRSSMNIEDHPNASFAGCFNSVVLNTVSEQTLWEGVLQVIQSAFTQSSIKRMLAEGVQLDQFKVGFLVQEWISCQLSGVCFSRNPACLWIKNGVVEWGRSGTGVVQGTGENHTASQFDPIPADLERFWHLLWMTAGKLERQLEGPVDIEWVWDGNQLWIVQVRLVATEEANLIRMTPKGQRWTREQLLERFPEPLTPLGYTVLEDFLDSNFKELDKTFGIITTDSQKAIVAFGGYLYANADIFCYHKIRVRFSHYLLPWKKSFWRFLKVILCFGFSRIKLLNALLGMKTDEVIARWDLHCEKYSGNLADFNHGIQHLHHFTAEQTLDALEELRIISKEFMKQDFVVYFLKDLHFKILRSEQKNLSLDLHRPLQNNRTSQMSAEWDSLMANLNADEGFLNFIHDLRAHSSDAFALAKRYLKSDTYTLWHEFFEKNGHLRTSWDISQPSWREAPENLAFILEKSTQSGRRRINNIPEQNVKLSPLVNKTLARLDELIRIDEEQHFISGRLFEPSRKIALHAADLFVQQGLLSEKGLIFFLTMEEIKNQLHSPGMSLNFLALRRKMQWQKSKENPKPMQLPSIPEKCSQEVASHLCGSPVSPGIATGPVHYIEHMEDAHDIPSGAIMLTTSPNPTFVAIYPLLAGMITVTGGPLSHGFLAAREAGLPAVSGILDAFKKLKPGTMVKIDGFAGTIDICKNG